jgi:hypothetical protein
MVQRMSALLQDEVRYITTFGLNVDGTEIYAWARSSALLSEIVDVALRLVAAA